MGIALVFVIQLVVGAYPDYVWERLAWHYYGVDTAYLQAHFATMKEALLHAVLPYAIGILVSYPAAVVLLDRLVRILWNIRKEDVFSKGNVESLRAMSWCCFFAAGVLAVAAVWAEVDFGVGLAGLRLLSMTSICFIGIAAAAAFAGLIIRVIKNCFAKAVALQEENDLTV
jgi:hypothetical protein